MPIRALIGSPHVGFARRKCVYLFAVAAVLLILSPLVFAVGPSDAEDIQRAIAHINKAEEFATGGDYKAAIGEQKNALDIRKRVFKHWHKLTVACYRNLAWLYLRQKQYEEAVVVYDECLAIEATKPPEQELRRLVSRERAWTLHSAAEYTAALSAYETLLADIPLVEDKRTKEEHIIVLQDAAKLLDDMQVDNVLMTHHLRQCDKILADGLTWSRQNKLYGLSFEMIRRQMQLLAYLGRYSDAEQLLNKYLKSLAKKAAVYEYQEFWALWLQHAEVVLVTKGSGVALNSLKVLANQTPKAASSIPYQSILLQATLEQGNHQQALNVCKNYYSSLQIAEKSGDVTSTHWMLVPQAYLALGEYEQAFNACNAILKRDISPLERTRALIVSLDIFSATHNWIEVHKQCDEIAKVWDSDTIPISYMVEVEAHRAHAYFEKGEFDNARKSLSLAIDRCRTAGDDHKVALIRALSNLGECEHQLGKLEAAEKYLREANKVCEAHLDEFNSLTFAVRSNLSRVLQAQGDYMGAEAYLAAELDFYLKNGNPREAAHTQQELALLCVYMGDFEQSRTFWKQAVQTIKLDSGGKGEQFAKACFTVGMLEYSMGNYRFAVTALNKALTTLGPSTPWPGFLRDEISLALGNAFSKQLRFEDANQQYQGVLENVSKLSDESNAARRLHADVLLGLCTTFRRSGNQIDTATKYAKHAVALYEKCFDANHPLIATAYEELGACYQASGDLAAAADALEVCRRMRVERYGEAHPGVLRALNNLAAVELAQSALLKDANARRDKIIRAEERLTKGLAAFKSQHGDSQQNNPVACKSYANLALIYAVQGKTDNALAQYETSLKGFLSYTRQNLIGLDEPEQLAFIEGELQPVLHAAYAFALHNRTRRDVCRAAAEWAANFKGLSQEITVAGQLLSKGTAGVPAELTAVVNQIAQTQVQVSRGELPSDAPIIGQLLKRRTDLSRQVDRDSTNDYALIAQQVASTAWLDAAALRGLVKSNDLLVDYVTFWYLDSTSSRWMLRGAMLVIPPEDNTSTQIELIDLGDIHQVVATLDEARKTLLATDAWDNANPSGEDGHEILEGLKASLQSTYAKTLQHCEGLLDKERNLFICPDDDLWFVPWACLPHKDGFLIEKHSVALLRSSRDLMRSDRKKPTESTAVLFADPDFSLVEIKETSQEPIAATVTSSEGSANVASSSLASQPSDSSAAVVYALNSPLVSRDIPQFDRAAETRAIEAIVPDLEQKCTVARHFGIGATEESFKKVVQAECLVMATHGFYQPLLDAGAQTEGPPWARQRPMSVLFENPLLRCGLALAGVNKPNSAYLRGEDGLLTGLEIATSDLRGTELVFLTACETGLGQIRCGESVAGLYQSFGLAGSRSVIGSLWNVHGKAATELTREFWKHMLNGEDHATSLRQAQLTFLRDEKYAQYRHPYFWAAFGLVTHR